MSGESTPPGQPVPVERLKLYKPRASLPGEMRNGWLAFESKAERRRLAPTPDSWELMSDRELAELVERAVSTGKAKQLIE